MKIADGLVMREVTGQHVVIATGALSRDFHGMVKLNDTGARIWHALERGEDAGAIAQGLAQDYEVDVASARADVDALIAQMREQGFVRE